MYYNHMHCKNCKYWRRGGGFYRTFSTGEIIRAIPQGSPWNAHTIAIVTDDSKKTGLCIHPANLGDYAESWLATESPPPLSPPRFDGARDVGEGGPVEFGEDFGCIHFAPK